MIDTMLETERLILRQWRESDIDDYAAMCADPDVVEFLTGNAMSRMEAWRHMAFLIGHWSLRGFGHWAVEEKATGKLIGRIGFLEPIDFPGFEIGWTLARASWGKGYANEGATAALNWAFQTLDKTEVISLIRPGNVNSIKVAERLGETYQGEVEVMGSRVLKYGMSRQRWFEVCGVVL